MQPHHAGYLVANMNNALKEFLNPGYEVGQEVIYDSLRNNGFSVEFI